MNIFGQDKLLKYIDRLIDSGQFPRFCIISGVRGCGKKLISSYIASKLGALFVPCELSVDAVRSVIDTAYEQTEPMMYMWADAHNMSLAAKNAILKVTEEPPQNSYFVLTTDNTAGLLNTLLSRGTLFNMSPYSVPELTEFVKYKRPDITDSNLNTVINIANTPQDIIDVLDIDIDKLNLYVTTLCDNIGNTNLANELKISTFLQFKEDDTDKYSPILFMRACMLRFAELFYNTADPMYDALIRITSKYLSEMSHKSLNKVSIVDTWIIDLHESALLGGELI